MSSARRIVEQGWTYAAAAKMFMVAPKTARKRADRYRDEGVAGMADRSSRPHTSPTKTRADVVRQIVRRDGATGSVWSRSPAVSACRFAEGRAE